MNDKQSEELIDTLCETSTHYVIDAGGQPVAVLLTLAEYDHYLDLLADEADSQDAELDARLRQARQDRNSKRMSFRDYLQQPPLNDGEVSP